MDKITDRDGTDSGLYLCAFWLPFISALQVVGLPPLPSLSPYVFSVWAVLYPLLNLLIFFLPRNKCIVVDRFRSVINVTIELDSCKLLRAVTHSKRSPRWPTGPSGGTWPDRATTEVIIRHVLCRM